MLNTSPSPAYSDSGKYTVPNSVLPSCLKNGKKLLNKRNVGVVLTDLSKAFDCINHVLLIAKLDAYGFENNALSFIYNYLTKRSQRTKVKDSYSSWRITSSGVPQGSIRGPLLFDIFLNDIFFVENTKIGNYADDSICYRVKRREIT